MENDRISVLKIFTKAKILLERGENEKFKKFVQQNKKFFPTKMKEVINQLDT